MVSRASKKKPKRSRAQEIQVDCPMLDVRALIVPDSANEEDRTIEIVWSTGARTLRQSFFEDDHFEELDMSPEAVRLERFNAGAPVLDSHGQVTHRAGGSGLQDMLGVVINGSATVNGTEGRCRVQLSQRSDVDDIWQDILDGIIQNVSVAYFVHRFRDVTETDDSIQVLRAIDWEPVEVSFVAIPVDTEAGVRSSSQSSICTIIGEGVSDMAQRTKKTGTKAAAKPAAKPAVKARAQSQQEETPVEPEEEETEEATEETPEETTEETSEETTEETEDTEEEEEETPAAESTETRNLQTDKKKKGRKQLTPEQRERQRMLGIQKAARTLGLPEDFELTKSLIARGSTLARSRGALINAAADLDEDENMTRNQTTQVGATNRSKLRAGVQNALEVRANLCGPDKKLIELTDAGRELRSYGLLRMGEECLRATGEKLSGMTRMDIASRALHGTSDFPAILENIANKTLRQAYDTTVLTYRFLARQRNAPDFKQMSSVQLGTGSGLTELSEGAEIKHGTLSDSAEKFALLTYARMLTLTRQALINDDTSAFDRLPAQLGRKAAELEQDVAWGLITGNVTMGDGDPLFDAAHSNVGTGALAIGSLSAGRSAMRLQTEPDGQLINVIPKLLFVPTTLETTAQQLTTQVNADQAGSVNPFATGQFSNVFTEPRLDAASALQWYMAADPGQIDVMQYGFLEGEAGPRIETQESFGRDGMAWRVLHDFYAAMLEHRGIYRSTGA